MYLLLMLFFISACAAIDSCPQDLKTCPDGSEVARNPDTCEFFECLDAKQACASDAKLCPDGSYVGRSGPDCTFECPEPCSINDPCAEGGCYGNGSEAYCYSHDNVCQIFCGSDGCSILESYPMGVQC